MINYLLDPRDPAVDALLGGKGRALALMLRAGLPVPPFVVVNPAAFDEATRLKGTRWATLGNDARAMKSALNALVLPAGLAVALREAVHSIAGPEGTLAVRSSASDEDGVAHSFAGQLESYLGVAPNDVADRILDVWRSGFSERLLAYRAERGLTDPPGAPAVIIQRQLDPVAAGVAFSADPVTGRRTVAVVASVWGLADALVRGDADADLFEIDRTDKIIRREIATKSTASRRDPQSPAGILEMPVDAVNRDRPSLNEAQVLEVATQVRALARFFGHPVDIEWAWTSNFWLVQARPITNLQKLPDPAGERAVWDNSNIVESYAGVTTPLTFSFARTAYEAVYREFCRLMGVSPRVIAANEHAFRRMIGLINGRVYYNLYSWYEVLALLPGFSINRPFMEQMMGVKEGLPPDLVAGLQARQNKALDAWNFLRMLALMLVYTQTLPGMIRKFYARLNTALDDKRPGAVPLAMQRPDELVRYYRSLESQLLDRWDAPLINDFFAMIFYGLLRKQATKWCSDTDGTLQNDLIASQGGIISAEPARQLRQMAEIASRNPELVRLLIAAPAADLMRVLDRSPELVAKVKSYLDKFGDRCLEELKLETETLADDPTWLLRSIGQLAQQGPIAYADRGEAMLGTDAEALVRERLQKQPLRLAIFLWILRHARARVRDRENLRFERTRLFGRVRRVFLELGERFTGEGVLQHPRDIFWLEVPEVLRYVEGIAASTALAGLVEVRRAEFARYRLLTPPADRFETYGAVYLGNQFQSSLTIAPPEIGGDSRQGIGCCPGVVSGPVRVVRDPRGVSLAPGTILVAERTDPGWILLFPASAGVLVERGSLLSHSAIVARELSIPAVVSVPGLTSWLSDGDEVEFDGRSGLIRLLRRADVRGDAHGL